MRNSFDDDEAREFVRRFEDLPEALALRIYTSRLLGGEPSLVLHGGGNTSLKLRTTNLLERLFGEERRRLRAAGSLFGERPVLKLMYSAVIRASDSWRGLKVSEFESAQLKKLQEQLTKEQKDDYLLKARPADAAHSKSM